MSGSAKPQMRKHLGALFRDAKVVEVQERVQLRRRDARA